MVVLQAKGKILNLAKLLDLESSVTELLSLTSLPISISEWLSEQGQAMSKYKIVQDIYGEALCKFTYHLLSEILIP